MMLKGYQRTKEMVLMPNLFGIFRIMVFIIPRNRIKSVLCLIAQLSSKANP
jgi:hypothetical protein